MFGNKKKQISERKRPDRSGSNAPVFSYYASRSQNETSTGRLQDPGKRGFNWKLLPSYIALLAILLSFIYVSTLNTNPRILRSAQNDSVVLQSTTTYQNSAQKLLASSVFNRSKLLIDTKKIERELKRQFPELSHVSITVPLISRRPIVAIEPAQPALILTVARNIYIIDDEGVAILKVKSIDKFNSLNLPHVTDESGLELGLGKAALSSDNAVFINEVSRQLEAKGLEIETMALPTVANELHVRVKGEGYFVKFNFRGDARLQAGTYLAVKDRLTRDNVKPAEYVDVRVEEKAFYK